MKIVVFSNGDAWDYLSNSNAAIEWARADEMIDFFETTDADAYINLAADSCNEAYSEIKKPVFINSVSTTLAKKNMPPHVIRINGWDGFLEKEIWEVAGQLSDAAKNILAALQKKYIVLKDEPGFVAARILAMIINEAYFAKEDEVSTEKEIDIAMKLGTNYPYGPFEWCNKIGIENVYELLETLAITDERYQPSAAMLTALNKKK